MSELETLRADAPRTRDRLAAAQHTVNALRAERHLQQLAMLRAGASLGEIAELTGVTRTQVRRIRDQHGIKPRPAGIPHREDTR